MNQRIASAALLLAVLGTAAYGADVYRSTAPDGTVSYSKALGLLTRAKANQAVEDFAECEDTASRARFFIAESRKGR